MTNSWRALATMARDRIVSTDPEDITLILGVRIELERFFLTSNTAVVSPSGVFISAPTVQPNLCRMHQFILCSQLDRTSRSTIVPV